ncbi:MAG: response regulator [Proteobacteria bacterium]|nr:response regulator [Pseudomonadota bacterium]MBU1686909.1 response regulator [Pseudomonadota bacterium]
MVVGSNSEPRRLLIIDDEAIVGKRLNQIFTKMGYVVEAHIDPVQAVAAAEQHPFDIVVTDLKMQGMDGLEVLRRVKKINPRTRVIIITGYAEMDTADAAFSGGVFDFIPKPFRLDEIKDAILRAVSDMAGDG